MKKVFTYVLIGLMCVLGYSQIRSMISPGKEILKYTTKLVVDAIDSDKIKIEVGSTEGGKDSLITIEEYIPHESPVVVYVDRDISNAEYYRVLAQLDSLLAASEDPIVIDEAKFLLTRLDSLWKGDYIRLGYEYQRYGFCFAPNIGLPFDLLADSSSSVSGVSLGSRLVYYDRFGAGLNGALYLDDDLKFDRVSGNLFIDGRLPYADNIAGGIFGGYDSKLKWNAGVLFNFYIN